MHTWEILGYFIRPFSESLSNKITSKYEENYYVPSSNTILPTGGLEAEREEE